MPPDIERNARLYPWYAAAFNAHFWLPVFFLYFSEHVSLENVLRLEAIYYAGVVVLEVPSGYFSDVVGRRATMRIAAVALVAACGLFLVGSSFAVFAAAQLCLAAGIAFNSGTDTAFHYASLSGLGREREFGAREAVATRAAFLAGAGAAVLGGVAATAQLRLAYGLSLLAAVTTLIITGFLVEPPAPAGADRRGFVRHLRRTAGELRNPSLRWLFLFATLMTVFNHVPYEFYQPYLDRLGAAGDRPDRGTPLVAGVHMGVAMLLGSWVAGRSMRVRDRLGTGRTLLAAMAGQAALIAAMGLVLHPIVAGLLLLRTAPRALMTAPLNAAVAPAVPEARRATFLSLQSLSGRLSFSATLAALSLVPGPGSAIAWAPLSVMLLICAGAALAALVAMAIARPRGLTAR